MLTKFRNYHAKEFYNKILFESKNFIVVPSLGALVEGWLLIVPKQEYLSFQYLDSISLLEELEEFSQQIAQIMTKEYGYVTMFEHGALQSESTVGCGVDYAHLHLVPINFDLILGLETFLGTRYDWNIVSGITDALKKKKEKSEYLFYKDYKGNSYIVNDKKIPSQLFRKVIAQYTNQKEKYDWKEYHQEENILKTIKKFQVHSIFQKVNI